MNWSRMLRRPRVTPGPALLALVLVAAVSCGGDKDEPATPTPAGTAITTATAPAATATPTRGPGTVLTPTPTLGPNVAAPGVDYVRDMCVATEEFVAGVTKKISTDQSLTEDSSRLLSAFGPGIEDYAAKVSSIRPPLEWRADHERFVAIMKDFVPKIRNGEVKTFSDFTAYFANTGRLRPINETAFKRIDEIIGQTEQCSTVGFIFGGL